MDRTHLRRMLPGLIALAGVGVLPASGARATDVYRMDRHVIAAGSSVAGSAAYRLAATLGQPATTRIASGSFAMQGGFRAAADDSIFRNGFESNPGE